MSTIGYAALTTQRDEATPGTSASSEAPGMRTYVDALAALVPAEVLTLHGLMLPVTTKITAGATVITNPDALFWALVGLLVLSIGLYAAQTREREVGRPGLASRGHPTARAPGLDDASKVNGL